MPTTKLTRIVLTPHDELPYKVVLSHENGDCSEHPVATVREGEELIRRHLRIEPALAAERLRDTPRQ